MTEHEHHWRPVDGYCALYRCACGATGHRTTSGIHEHRIHREIRVPLTARPLLERDGRVPARLPESELEWRGRR